MTVNHTTEGPTSGQPVFTPISHPVLKRCGQKYIRQFIDKREQYLSHIDDAQAAGSTISAVSLKSSIDRRLLKNLVLYKELPNITKVDDATDQALQTWLDRQDGRGTEDLSPEALEALVKKSVFMNVSEGDPEHRSKSLFWDYTDFLTQHKWEGLLKDNPKLAVSHICMLLKPAALKTKVETDLAISKHKLKKDWMAFYAYVTAQAIACDAFVPVTSSAAVRGTLRRTAVPRTGDPHKPDDDSKGDAIRGTPPKLGSGNPLDQFKGISATPPAPPKPPANDPPDCLNPKCPGKHYLKDCPITPPEERQPLYDAYYNRKKKSPKALKASKVTSTPPSGIGNNGRFKARLADAVDVLVNGDYGADHAAISTQHLEQLADSGVYISTLPLKKPVLFEMAVSDTSTETREARAKARISTTLMTYHGPFRLRNVEYLVFDGYMTEVLLSRPILQSLGFDLASHLKAVHHRYHDADFSNIGFLPGEVPDARPAGQLASLLAQPDLSSGDPGLMPVDDETGSPVSSSVLLDSPSTTEDPIFYGDILADDPLDSDLDLPTGVDDTTKTKQELLKQVHQAGAAGFPASDLPKLKSLALSYSDVFRTTLGSDPPMKVPPMNVRLQADAKPVRVKVRRYSPPQAAFLKTEVQKLEHLGLIRRNTESTWACAPLVVPKAGPDKFRLTIDLRPVNSQTVPFAWPMPSLESVVSEVAGDACFATFDLCHGYWQMPLHPDSQECQSFITQDGVYTPTRVLQGQTNAVPYFQSAVSNIIKPLRDRILQWLDDLLMHCPTPQDLLTTLESFFQLCRQHNIKLHARKCKFYLPEVTWCGRLISQDGVRFDPRNYAAITDMQVPTTGAELQQLLCASNWMRSAIPQYTTIVQPLQDLMEHVYTTAGGRTKNAVSKVALRGDWSSSHEDSFAKLQQALIHAVTLAHPDPTKLLCLFTDASDRQWSSVLTQVPAIDADELFGEQHHEPLSFLSGSFTGSAFRWSTAEKEAYAIVASVYRLDYLLLRPQGFDLYTDHRNLTFIFSPLAVSPHLSKAALNKIERWALLLSAFRYTVSHIPGPENCWADLLSRWAAPFNQPSLSLPALLRAPVAPELDPDFHWPNLPALRTSQQAALSDADRPETCSNDLFVYNDGAVWIPKDDTSLQPRICIIGHCGRGGHRGADTTYTNIKDHFRWLNMKPDVSVFCNTCLHCAASSGNKRVPRPLGHALHADKPNELIHFDFLYMGPGTAGYSYVLIVKDDCSSLVWLEPTATADADSAAAVLSRWFSLFGVVPTWVSDQGSHFKNSLMTAINRTLHSHHHFTTAYCPQANGTVEVICKEVLRAARSLLSEYRLSEDQWPAVIHIIQSILDHSKRAYLNNQAPITVFSGLPADNPLTALVPPTISEVPSLDFVQTQRLINVSRLIDALDAMHKDVSKRKTKLREQAVVRHNEKTHVQAVNFELGDFVLVAKRVSQDGHKLRVRWLGPRRISAIHSAHVYETQDLINNNRSLVHVNRLKKYADSSLDVTEELLDAIHHNEPHYNTVERLLALRFNQAVEHYEVQVKWRGFDYEAPTWEPLAVMYEDIPKMLNEFLQTYGDQALATAAQGTL